MELTANEAEAYLVGGQLGKKKEKGLYMKCKNRDGGRERMLMGCYHGYFGGSWVESDSLLGIDFS